MCIRDRNKLTIFSFLGRGCAPSLAPTDLPAPLTIVARVLVLAGSNSPVSVVEQSAQTAWRTWQWTWSTAAGRSSRPAGVDDSRTVTTAASRHPGSTTNVAVIRNVIHRLAAALNQLQ